MLAAQIGALRAGLMITHDTGDLVFPVLSVLMFVRSLVPVRDIVLWVVTTPYSAFVNFS